jgi:GT2 family glycosyltransferase
MFAHGRLAVVLVNFEGLEDTLKCLESLTRQTVPAAQLIVVDNASRQDPGAVARLYPNCLLLRRRDNGGWAGGNNTGIRAALRAGCQQVVLLNNDTVVAPNFVERLRMVSAAHPQYAVMGPLIYSLDRPDELMTAGCQFNRANEAGFFQHQEVPVAIAEPPVACATDVVNGCCIMIQAAVFESIGLIDEEFFLVHEESDFCLRAHEAGFHCGILAEPLVWHKGSSAFGRTGKHLQRYYDARNLCRLLRKHSSSHPGRRLPMRSIWEYLKYVYYRYCIEREHGQDLAADGVLEGLYDAVAGHYGCFVSHARPGMPALKRLFEWWRLRRRSEHCGSYS